MPTKPAKILSVLISLLYSHHSVSQPDQRGRQLNEVGHRIVVQAQRDVGVQELTWRNDNRLFDYYRVLGGNNNRATVKGWKDAYCAYALYAWHRQAGVKPNVPALGRAYSWSKHPSRLTLGRFATATNLSKLQPGWVIGFRFESNHVGIIEEPYALYAHTIEANTSTKNAVGAYKTNHDGVIRKRRFYKDAVWAADWRGSPVSDTITPFKLRAKFSKPP